MPSAAEYHYHDFLESIPDLPDSEFLIYGTVLVIRSDYIISID
jgi:hypothetical protein